MPNQRYKRGANKERRIVKKARDRGDIAFRSAGSHSEFDGVILYWNKREIIFFQSKTGRSYDNLKDGTPNSLIRPIIERFDFLNDKAKGEWKVRFEIY